MIISRHILRLVDDPVDVTRPLVKNQHLILLEAILVTRSPRALLLLQYLIHFLFHISLLVNRAASCPQRHVILLLKWRQLVVLVVYVLIVHRHVQLLKRPLTLLATSLRAFIFSSVLLLFIEWRAAAMRVLIAQLLLLECWVLAGVVDWGRLGGGGDYFGAANWGQARAIVGFPFADNILHFLALLLLLFDQLLLF